MPIQKPKEGQEVKENNLETTAPEVRPSEAGLEAEKKVEMPAEKVKEVPEAPKEEPVVKEEKPTAAPTTAPTEPEKSETLEEIEDILEEDVDEFYEKTKEIYKGVYRVLKPGKFFCVLIGEAFGKGGEVIPLDYHLTKMGLETNFKFYSKVIKITREATSRRNQMNIMKFRSLRSNFFICMHDYVLIFRKPL